jgi:hypothetical protein
MPQQILERDWKQFSKLKPELLNRFCQKILDEAARIATTKADSPHDQYLDLFKFIDEENRKIADAFNDHRRSTALWMIAHLYGHGMMTEEELMTFSEETRESVLFMCKPPQ